LPGKRKRDELGSPVQRVGTRRFGLSTHRRQRPLFAPQQVEEIAAVLDTDPTTHGLSGAGWTLKKLRRWFFDKVKRLPSRSLLHKVLHTAGWSWKKCKKLLGKGRPEDRAAFVKRLRELYDQVCSGEVILVYIDEAHIHRDLDLGYTWGRLGRRVWRVSGCAPLSDRINWYGAFNFSDGRCLIWNEGNCRKEQTAEFLQRVDDWLPKGGRRVVIIWDNAPWHKAGWVQQAAADLGFELVRLPSYSPDLNPIEGLWKWMREEVTQHRYYDTMRGLFLACIEFVNRINADDLEMINRLWPRFDLDPESEKLRVSA
jgi:transposase